MKADFARQLAAAEARIADIEQARAAAEQQAAQVAEKLASSQAATDQVWGCLMVHTAA
jgi:hypothetical protein